MLSAGPPLIVCRSFEIVHRVRVDPQHGGFSSHNKWLLHSATHCKLGLFMETRYQSWRIEHIHDGLTHEGDELHLGRDDPENLVCALEETTKLLHYGMAHICVLGIAWQCPVGHASKSGCPKDFAPTTSRHLHFKRRCWIPLEHQ